MNDVTDPQTGITIKERRYAKTLVDADKGSRTKLWGNKAYKLGALGAGSDYSPFIQHLGIASMNLGFGGESSGGEYHSIYDSYDLFTKFKDPGFKYGIALAKTAGRVLLRLANADALPFDFNAFYKTVAEYAAEVKALQDNARTETEMENKMISDKIFDVAKDPKKVYASPKIKEAVPYLNFSALDNTLMQLKETSEAFQKRFSLVNDLIADKKKAVNDLLYKAERMLVQGEGLPRRPWYKHQIYAPGFYTGYGVKTLPAIREAIEQRNWKEAQTSIDVVAQNLGLYNIQVKKAMDLLPKTF
jgi:N-acetylated-alpha-linked acidic dipeptidase